MEVWIDATGLAAASHEAKSYGREMLRSLLEAGPEHDYRFAGWPSSELGSVERFLGPLGRDVKERLSSLRSRRGAWVLYNPVGVPALETSCRRCLPPSRPAIRVATLLGERPQAAGAEEMTIVTLTQAALQAVSAVNALDAPDVRWVPPGLGSSGQARAQGRRVSIPEGDYVLAAGVNAADPPESIAGLWRILRAFRAFRRAANRPMCPDNRPRCPDNRPRSPSIHSVRLVLLGGAPFPLRQAAACLGLARDVSFFPLRPGDDFARLCLVASAAAFVHVSRPDASWLAGAEAMRSGVPIVAPRTASAQEVWGESALYYAEGSTSEISSSLARVMGSAGLRRELSRKGIARGQAFTWEAAAHRLLDCFAEGGRAGRAPVGEGWAALAR